MQDFPLDPLELPQFQNISGKKVESLKKALEDPETVKWLKLSGPLMNDIFPITLPEELSKLTQLEILELEYYPSIDWNHQLQKLPQLKTLICLGNEFAPAGLILDEQLSDLEQLYLDLFYDIEIKDSFSHCKALKTLWIVESRVSGLEQLNHLSQLEELCLDIDNDEDIPDLSTIRQLRKLKITSKEGSPKWISKLPHLEHPETA